MAAVMSATDSARARDEWRLAIHRRSMRGVANACRPHTEGPWRWEFNPSTKSTGAEQ